MRLLLSFKVATFVASYLKDANFLVTLGWDFFDEIIARPVPIDKRVLKALKRSPMAIDIYCWLTYRMSYLRRRTSIPWEALQMQFGADYGANAQGLRDFRRALLKHLHAVKAVYPLANVEEAEQGLMLLPRHTHVSRLPVDNFVFLESYPRINGLAFSSQAQQLRGFPGSTYIYLYDYL